MKLKIIPATASLGATVSGIRLASLSDAEFVQVEAAFHKHAVLIFPGQHPDDDEQMAFASRFGELSIKAQPFSNEKEDGSLWHPSDPLMQLFKGNEGWHTDSSFQSVAAKASILSARKVPSQGGETEWADMRAAYDALDDAMKARLADKIAVHSYEFSHAPFGGMDVLNEEELAHLAPVEHPVIRIHPATGRKNLFVGRHASHILGEDLEGSRKLLADLTNEAAQSPRTYKHTWQPGDIVMWDNRCVLHRGRRWPDDQPRTMVRTTVAGDGMDAKWLLETA